MCPHSNNLNFVDTNCYFFLRSAFTILRMWLFKEKSESLYGDRILWNTIKDMNICRVHIPLPTVNYTTDYASHYQIFNKKISDHARFFSEKEMNFITYAEYCESLGNPNLV